VFVWDAHSGFMPDPAADLDNLRSWRDAGVDFLSVNVGFDALPWRNAVATARAFRDWICAHGEEYAVAETIAEVERAKAGGKMAVAFDLEGMNALDGRLEMLEEYHRLGVRQILFAYNRNNAAGGGCHDDDPGLTPFGRDAIDEMNRLGIVVDVSHCGFRTSLEAIERSHKPVIFSHSNPRALYDHERNVRDEQIAACAASGGVIGAAGINIMLGGDEPSVELLAEHVEYLIDRAGPEHVGIGLDYSFPVENADVSAFVSDHPEFWPPERGYANVEARFLAPSVLPQLASELQRRGHPETVVRGVLGENFLRVAREAWA